MVDYLRNGEDVIVNKAVLSDLENACHLPITHSIKSLRGNENWRSPEMMFKSHLNWPTDIYSFGAVVRTSLTNQRQMLTIISAYMQSSDASFLPLIRTCVVVWSLA